MTPESIIAELRDALSVANRDLSDLRAKLATRDTEVTDARTVALHLERITLRLTGMTCAEAMAASDLTERELRAAERYQLDQMMPFDVSDSAPDRDVVDVDYHDEPAYSRVPTRPEVQRTMSELVWPVQP